MTNYDIIKRVYLENPTRIECHVTCTADWQQINQFPRKYTDEDGTTWNYLIMCREELYEIQFTGPLSRIESLWDQLTIALEDYHLPTPELINFVDCTDPGDELQSSLKLSFKERKETPSIRYSNFPIRS